MRPGLVFEDYVKLTEPGINVLVMLTGFVGMWSASRGLPHDKWGILWGLLGLWLASAGSSVFNNYYDRDIDRLMLRTSARPMPAGRISPGSALVFGAVLSCLSFAVLATFVNMLSAVLSVLSIFLYAYVYTVLLKRHTPYATEVGGIAGAMPPVIGWAVVRGDVGLGAILLFAIMLLWQPPHFWALASKYKDDYKKAGIPVMPLKRSDRETNVRSMAYVAALVFSSLIPYYVHMAGRLYLIAALAAGLFYFALYVKVLFLRQDLNRQLFLYSIVYLTFSFIALAIDVKV
ncbi:MAG: protoheme IX farnesyltransferase [Nitrospirae bacterium]|nr:protoheme IX farnesyltransferase [Nitrospirota bacterium]